MSRKYHSLLSRDAKGEPWGIEFGAFDRVDVENELADYLDHDIKRANLKIITTGAAQGDINHAVFLLNHPTAKV